MRQRTSYSDLSKEEKLRRRQRRGEVVQSTPLKNKKSPRPESEAHKEKMRQVEQRRKIKAERTEQHRVNKELKDKVTREGRINPPVSRFQGVRWSLKSGKWLALVKYQGEKYYCGFFKSDTIAAMYYNYKVVELYGEDKNRLNVLKADWRSTCHYLNKGEQS